MTHFFQGGTRTVCGIDTKQGGFITTTGHKAAVTCPDCRDTPQWRLARQVIPQVQGGPYRG